MHDSVITGREYVSKDSTCVISMFSTSFNVYFVWLCMFYVYMPQNCYLAFLGQGPAFFREDRLATLLCSLARFDLANRGVHQAIQPRTYARLLVFDETLAQPHLAVVNCSDAVMSVFYSPFSKRRQNFELRTLVSQH